MQFLIRLFLFCVLSSSICLGTGAPSIVHNFAQFADGGGIGTSCLIMNQGSEAVDVTIAFFNDAGADLALDFEGASRSSFSIAVPAGGMKRLSTGGTDESLKVGWARLTASGPVGAQVLFELRTGGELVTQAAVEPTGPVSQVTIFAQQDAGSRTGVAAANLSGVGAVLIRLTLIDAAGQEVSSVDRVLPPHGHLAQFLSEIFEQLPADFRGTVLINASGPITVITLLQTGLILGTLPVVELHQLF